MMAATIQQETFQPRRASYEHVEKLLHYICCRFQRSHGGDYDDLFSDASEAYCIAYNTFDGTRKNFSGWVYYRVWVGLQKCLAARRKQTAHETYGLKMEALAALDDGPYSLLAEVSNDAAVVLRLALEPPPDIVALMKEREHEEPAEKPVDRRRGAIMTFLLELGWTWRRVAESFAEVREALP